MIKKLADIGIFHVEVHLGKDFTIVSHKFQVSVDKFHNISRIDNIKIEKVITWLLSYILGISSELLI